MKKLTGLFLALLLFTVALPALAQESESTVSASEAGIMAGVTELCWETGDCSLNDFLQVFVNISDYILGIVGSLALLLFVIGGFYLLASQGESGRVQKGKAYITGAIVGIIIVFVAYIGVQTIESTITRGTIAGSSAEYVPCTFDTEDGTSCDVNAVCENGICTTLCNYQEAGVCYSESTHGLAPNCSSGAGLCPLGSEEVCCTEVDIGEAPEEF